MLVVIGVLGLLVGSFLNVVIHRVPRGESLLRPGSHCPRCSAAVRPWHNVPMVSWLALRGRCGTCRQAISPRYLLVELATAALFVAVTVRFGFTAVLPAYLYLAAVAVALSVIDLDVQRLPNAIVLPSYAVGTLLLLPTAVVDRDWSTVLRGLAAMAVLWVAYFALAHVIRGGLGFGDVKLAGLLGLYLGWLGWGPVLIGTLGGFLLGGIVGVVLLITRLGGRRTRLAFGPYMLAGAFVALFLSGPIATWYSSLLVPTV